MENLELVTEQELEELANRPARKQSKPPTEVLKPSMEESSAGVISMKEISTKENITLSPQKIAEMDAIVGLTPQKITQMDAIVNSMTDNKVENKYTTATDVEGIENFTDQEAKARYNLISNISTKKYMEYKNKGKMNFAESIGRNWNKAIPFNDVAELASIGRLTFLNNKLRKGESLSTKEKKDLEEYYAEQQEMAVRGTTFGYNLTAGVAESVGFMGEFLGAEAISAGLGVVSGGVGTIASQGAIAARLTQKSGAKVGLKYAKRQLNKSIKQSFTKNAMKRQLATAITFTPRAIATGGERKITNGMNITEKGDVLFDNESKELSTKKALALGFADIALAVTVERFIGREAGAVFNYLDKKTVNAVRRAIPEKEWTRLSKMIAEKYPKVPVSNFMKLPEYQGFREELFEEWFEGIARPAIELQDDIEKSKSQEVGEAILFNGGDNFLTTVGVIGVLGGMSHATTHTIKRLQANGVGLEEATELATQMTETSKDRLFTEDLPSFTGEELGSKVENAQYTDVEEEFKTKIQTKLFSKEQTEEEIAQQKTKRNLVNSAFRSIAKQTEWGKDKKMSNGVITRMVNSGEMQGKLLSDIEAIADIINNVVKDFDLTTRLGIKKDATPEEVIDALERTRNEKVIDANQQLYSKANLLKGTIKKAETSRLKDIATLEAFGWVNQQELGLQKGLLKQIGISDVDVSTGTPQEVFFNIGEATPLEKGQLKKIETEAQRNRKAKKKLQEQAIKKIDDATEVEKKVKVAIRNWVADIKSDQYGITTVLNDFINVTKEYAKKLKKDNIKTNDLNIREIMPFLRERTGVPGELKRPELTKLYNELSTAQKKELTALADKMSEFFNKYYEQYQIANGKEYESLIDIENYITHIWDIDNQERPLVTNYFTERSKFAKLRSIGTFFEGIKGFKASDGTFVQLKPRTLDYAELLNAQGNSFVKAIHNKKLADYAKSLTKGKLPLVLPFYKAPATWKSIDHPALRKVVMLGVDEKAGEKVSIELQNILSDIGIAIGRRISPVAFGKKVKTLGAYKKGKQPPEISLQRWFSDKTLRHEIGHAIDDFLGLGEDFFKRHQNELLKINAKRIEIFKGTKQAKYAESPAEQIAELFPVIFGDLETAQTLAPSATMEVLDRMANHEGFKNLLPENFDWANAKNLIEEKTNMFMKMGVKVHPDVEKPLLLAFETDGISEVGKWYDTVNAFMKMSQLGFSLFHAGALTESALFNLGFGRTLNTYYDIIKDVVIGTDMAIDNETLVKEGLRAGLSVEASSDVMRGTVDKALSDAEKKLGKLGVLPNIAKKLVNANNKFLWDYLHTELKLRTFEKISKQYPTKSKEAIAQWVNDSYGGQQWENIGVKQSSRKWYHRAILSPDWLISTTRQGNAFFQSKGMQKFWNKTLQRKDKSKFQNRLYDLMKFVGLSDIDGDIHKADVTGAIAKRFWLQALTASFVAASLLNALIRAFDMDENPEYYTDVEEDDWVALTMAGNAKGRKTYIFIGRDKNGKEKYLRFGKQFRENIEMLESPRKKVGGKVSPILQFIQKSAQLTTDDETIKTISGYEYKNPAFKKEGIDKVVAIAGEVAKNFMPFSMSALANPYKDFDPVNLVYPTSKGAGWLEGVKRYESVIKRYEKSSNKKSIEKEIKQITQDLIRNNVNWESSLNSAITGWKPQFDDAQSKLYREVKEGKPPKTKEEKKIANKIKKSEKTRKSQRRNIEREKKKAVKRIEKKAKN